MDKTGKTDRMASDTSKIVSTGSVDCGGLRLKFIHAGMGPTLILVHGLLGYSFSWRHVIPMLSQHREVFALDMPGAGFSDCSDHLDCRLKSAAGRLLAFMDAAAIAKCDLVGSSYGGSTAMMLAGLAPSRIRSLVLVSPANPWSRIGRKRLALLRWPMIARLFPIVARGVRPMHRYFVRRMWGDPRKVASETLDGYSLPLAQRGVFEHAVRIVQSWKPDMEEFKAALPKIAGIPTLLVWGSRDRVVAPASAESIRELLPGAELTTIQGSGHLPYEENPKDFAHIVLDFLTRIDT